MAYIEGNRYLYLETPLGENKLLLQRFSGHEALSQLFDFSLDLLAENATTVDFDKLIGKRVSFGVQGTDPRAEARHFNGIVIEVSQGERDREFTNYRIRVVPDLWVLTRRHQSRIFQHLNIPDILKAVLAGFDVAYELQGTFEPREYCTQYRETDFDFLSRLMEEEGIYYFFKFTKGAHKLVLANTPQSHSEIPGSSRLIYEVVTGGHRDEERIDRWQKDQYWGSGKVTLWDHHFELPHKTLEAQESVIGTLNVGKVQHKLKLSGNDGLEVYDYPGRYAQRFDGIDKGGGEKPSDLTKIFTDNRRTAGIRMQEIESGMIQIQAAGNCRMITAGHKFTLQRHFNADGQYVVHQVTHSGAEADFRSEQSDESGHYVNEFTCFPLELPFRPPQVTRRPVIAGPQTAVVVGPSGEEIFTDKYGRVKVQFHWDREGKYDADSSCWLRVATLWAGKQWGSVFIPRIGHEVIVGFLEGDPDRPVIVGSVYNADTMPPYALPANKTRSGIKSNSSIGSGGFNEIRFEDKKDNEQIFIHGQKDSDIRIERDHREWYGRDRHQEVTRDRVENVNRDAHLTVSRDSLAKIGRDMNLTVSGKSAAAIGGSSSLKVSGDVIEQFGADQSTAVTGTCQISGMNVVIEGQTGVTIKCGGNFITINPAGIQIVGTMVLINSGGAPIPAVPKMIVAPASPAKAQEADKAVAGSEVKYQQEGSKMSALHMQSQASSSAASASSQEPEPPSHDPKSEENKKKPHFIEIELMDENGKPAAGVAYRVTLPDGSVDEGTLDEKGYARIDGIDPGTCRVTFPDFDKEAWEPG